MGTKRLGMVAAIGLLIMAAPAQARLEKGSRSEVSFTAKGPAGMNIIGKTGELQLHDDGKTVLVSVPLRNLTTGIALRDRHLREKYLQVESYPTAELQVSRSALKVPGGSGAVSGTAKGQMKIHGKTRTVDFQYSARRAGQGYQVVGSVRVNIGDYGIQTPSFLGVTVKPDVDVAVSFDAKETVPAVGSSKP